MISVSTSGGERLKDVAILSKPVSPRYCEARQSLLSA